MFTGGKLFVNNNVVKDPMKDFNACDDFFMTVLTSHITAAAMKYMQIESLAEVCECLCRL